MQTELKFKVEIIQAGEVINSCETITSLDNAKTRVNRILGSGQKFRILQKSIGDWFQIERGKYNPESVSFLGLGDAPGAFRRYA